MCGGLVAGGPNRSRATGGCSRASLSLADNESLAGARAPGWTGVSGPTTISALKADGTLLKYVYNVTDLKPPVRHFLAQIFTTLTALSRLCVGTRRRRALPSPARALNWAT